MLAVAGLVALTAIGFYRFGNVQPGAPVSSATPVASVPVKPATAFPTPSLPAAPTPVQEASESFTAARSPHTPALPSSAPIEEPTLSPYQRMAQAEPYRPIPLVPPPPAGFEEVRLRLAEETEATTVQALITKLEALPGINALRYDTAAHELIVVEAPSALPAKALAEQARESGLAVRGEVLNLPLELSEHARGCGSCGAYIYQKLAATPEVTKVEVFIPVHSQLRILANPGAFTPQAVAQFIAASTPDLSQPLP